MKKANIKWNKKKIKIETNSSFGGAVQLAVIELFRTFFLSSFSKVYKPNRPSSSCSFIYKERERKGERGKRKSIFYRLHWIRKIMEKNIYSTDEWRENEKENIVFYVMDSEFSFWLWNGRTRDFAGAEAGCWRMKRECEGENDDSDGGAETFFAKDRKIYFLSWMNLRPEMEITCNFIMTFNDMVYNR